MSIVALKNKAHAMYDSHSRGNDGFSLNGKSRFTSGVGANLGRSVTRTPFRGTEPMGHGGGPRCRVSGIEARVNHCNGPQYPRFVANSGTCITRQYLVKPSVMNTSGMIQSRFMGILHGTYPRVWVQSPQISNAMLQEKLSSEAVAAACQPVFPEDATPEEKAEVAAACEKRAIEKSGTGSVEATNGCGPYTKSNSAVGPLASEEYLMRIKSPLLNPTCDKVPFPIPFSASSGCKSFYATWQEAQKAGLLCSSFKGR